MKLSWNSLLVTLAILLSTSSTGLAQSPNLSEVASQQRKQLQIDSTTANDLKQPTRVTKREIEATPEQEKRPDSERRRERETTTESENSRQDRNRAKKPSQEEIRFQKLAKADELYLAGKKVAAEKLYREVKKPFASEKSKSKIEQTPKAFDDPAKLNPAGAVYWRLYNEGLKDELESKILAPLKLLTEQHPEFIPGHLRYAEALKKYQKESEARKVLEQAAAKYPSEPKLVQAKIKADEEGERWLEASISARQFALFNPKHGQAKKFTGLADAYMERYKDHLNSKLTWNAIGNVITGALGYALIGNIGGPISALETTIMLMQGESAVGDRFSGRVKESLPMMKDKEVLNYVRSVGNKLASVTGRDEFKYEFYIIMDDRLNAFALPGGKIFIHAGAIMKTNSEAELAGLLAHEISHAVLSHGFQLVTQGNLTANVTQFIPYVGGIGGNLLVLDYSRDMERQADTFGTRILVAADYAADGMRNLMVILDKENKSDNPPAWLSTHPDTEERVKYLEDTIVTNHLNRYAYEGVSQHKKIKERVKKLWKKFKKSEEYQEMMENREEY